MANPNRRRPAQLLITELTPAHRAHVLQHLQSLSPDDRRLRFGVCMPDASLRRYVYSIPFDRDTVFGAFDDSANLVGIVHVGFDPRQAELGLTVDPRARRMGVGARLLRRAAVHAQARGAQRLLMYYLPENTSLRSLAARAGMRLEVERGEPTAVLSLPEPAPEAWLTEALDAALTALDLGFRIAGRDSLAAPPILGTPKAQTRQSALVTSA